MKRDKAWWGRLTSEERSDLVYLERSEYRSGSSWNLPDDCSECGACGTPHLSHGLCPRCSDRLRALIVKAGGVSRET